MSWLAFAGGVGGCIGGWIIWLTGTGSIWAAVATSVMLVAQLALVYNHLRHSS